jgi:AcrR family transcriptional regulator
MRVLAVGVSILEECGYAGFTIAAVCERADVSVAAIYARVASKEALFFAVYEHMLALVEGERADFDQIDPRRDRPISLVVAEVTALVAREFIAHRPFMRAVILLSGDNAEVRRRGSLWTRALGDRFTAALLSRRDDLVGEDIELEVDACYRSVFSSVAIYVAYGATFQSRREITDETFVRELQTMAVRYLLRNSPLLP